MRILHIGDLHFRSTKNTYEQNKIISKMIETLKKNPQIDMVFFTGDLVFSGSKYQDFENAFELLINPLIKELNIKKENFIICPGNHDINREECSQAVINYIDSRITTNDALNDFVSKKSTKDYKTSIAPTSNYIRFLEQQMSINKPSPLMEVYEKSFDNLKVGVVSLNTSWLSSGFREDLNNLLFPTNLIKEAIEKIKSCKLKIILIHHPISNLKEFNQIEVQRLVHGEFQLMFSGHIHRAQIGTQYVANNGIFCNTTEATLSFDSDSGLGYSITNIDIENFNCLELERFSFNQNEKEFVKLQSIEITIPTGVEKAKQNKLIEQIRKKYIFELNVANQLLLNYQEQNEQHFLDVFTIPVLSKRSSGENVANENELSFDFNILEQTNENYIFFGQDKCGKTTMLKKMQLFYLKNYSSLGKLPFYFDYKDLEHKESVLEITKLIANYYSVNFKDAEELIKNNFILLIDNFNPNSEIHGNILEFLEKNASIQFFICSEFVTTRLIFEKLDDLKYTKIYFKDLTRKEIRLFTEKQPQIKQDEQELVFDRITSVCKQLNLPLNYWTFSLIILIFKRGNDDYNKNLFSILDACVDEILLKKKLLFAKSNLKFEQYKILCSQIAHFLLTEHKENTYSADYNEMIGFISEYMKKNIRIVGDTKSIFDFLFETGILKQVGNRYTFRLNGIFEYFLASYIKDNPEFKNEILSNDSIYLVFKNELEIYSGFNRSDESFLRSIFNKTKTVFDPINRRYREISDIDSLLAIKITEANEFMTELKKLVVTKPIDHDIQDELADLSDPLSFESEVHLKPDIDKITLDFETLEKYIMILSRVFKNSDSIVDIKFIYEIFDFILESYCYFGFYLMDEFEKFAKEEYTKVSDDKNPQKAIGKKIASAMTQLIPVLTQVMLFDGIGHINLKNIIQQKINECSEDVKNNQYKLFLLYFLLIDSDLKNNKNLISEVFDKVNLPALKFSTFLKLNFYLAFKAVKNKELELFLKNSILTAKLRLNKRTDKGEFQKGISKKQRANLLKKRF